MNNLKVKKSGRVIKSEYVDCYGIWNYCIYEDDKLIGRAILINNIDDTYDTFLDLYIYEEEDRRKGAGSDLMQFVTDLHSEIKSSFLSSAGRDLALKHGFKIKKSLVKKKPDMLIYKRER